MVDCDDDGSITDKDQCYVLYEDLDGDGQYTTGVDGKIKAERASSTIKFINEEGPGGLAFFFTPTGEAKARDVAIMAAVETRESCCSSRCMTVSYPIEVSHVGRIRVGEKDAGCAGESNESCVDPSYCYM
jgi:hypothetical protein